MDDTPRSLELFPHDRVVFFSDAVFAIAITLLAIELRPPTHELIQRIGAGQAWGDMIPMFIAYVISFIVTAVYWTSHVQVWKFVREVTPRLVWINVLLLMFVALVPFGTNLYSESFEGGSVASFAIYAVILTGIASFSLWMRVAVTRQERLAERIGARHARWFVVRALIPLLVFAAAVPLSFLLPNWVGSLLFTMIWPLSAIAERWVKLQPAEPKEGGG